MGKEWDFRGIQKSVSGSPINALRRLPSLHRDSPERYDLQGKNLDSIGSLREEIERLKVPQKNAAGGRSFSILYPGGFQGRFHVKKNYNP